MTENKSDEVLILFPDHMWFLSTKMALEEMVASHAGVSGVSIKDTMILPSWEKVMYPDYKKILDGRNTAEKMSNNSTEKNMIHETS